MRERFSRSGLGSIIVAAGAVAAGVFSLSIDRTTAQVQAGSTSAPALKTAWGEPDLQGIWTDETDTSLQRPARYAGQEFFTPEQRAELDRVRADLLGSERERFERGTA